MGQYVTCGKPRSRCTRGRNTVPLYYLSWKEQYSLRWQDIDLKREIITIPHSEPREKHHLPINSTASTALEGLRGRADSSGFVYGWC